MENLGTFKIAEPCHADWNEMSPASQGRFCASCQKCVVDFTQKTTAEIKAVYDENAGNVCGRVKASQVVQARPAWHARPKTLRSRALKAVQMFALALLTTFGFMLHSEVHAQEREIMGKVAYVPELQQQTEVFGRVMLDTGAPAARASVLLLRDGNTIAESKTDAKGMYRFRKVQPGQYELIAYGDGGLSGSILHRATARPLQCTDLQLEHPMLMGQMMYIPDELIAPEPRIHRDTIEQLEILEPTDAVTHPVLDTDAQPVTSTVTPLDADAALNKVVDGSEAILLSGFEFKVFPNPTTDKITLVVDKVGTELLEVTLWDIDGRIVYEGVWVPAMESRKTVGMQALPAGIYFLRLAAGEQAVHRQLLKI